MVIQNTKQFILLDPFSGSGTTLIESINNNRQAFGIELEEKYFNLSKERINKECKIISEKLYHQEKLHQYTMNRRVFSS